LALPRSTVSEEAGSPRGVTSKRSHERFRFRVCKDWQLCCPIHQDHLRPNSYGPEGDRPVPAIQPDHRRSEVGSYFKRGSCEGVNRGNLTKATLYDHGQKGVSRRSRQEPWSCISLRRVVMAERATNGSRKGIGDNAGSLPRARRRSNSKTSRCLTSGAKPVAQSFSAEAAA